jgi:hypothetical protein
MDRNKLALIASVIGVVSVGGVATTVWQAGQDVTALELRDAGVMDCPTRLVTCNWRIDADGANILADAGVSVPPGYRALATRIKVCTQADGTRDVVVPPLPQRAGRLAALASPDLANCTVAADPGGALWRVAASQCVAAPVGDPRCKRDEHDGGFRWIGDLNRMPRSESNGHASCIDVPCGVFAGETP